MRVLFSYLLCFSEDRLNSKITKINLTRLLYSLTIYLFLGTARLLAFFKSRLSVFINSRENLISDLNQFNAGQKKLIWIHCASLGEFEQGRPVIEQIRSVFPHYKLLLTFFSPSGFEIRKNYPLVDKVTYLPFDTPGMTRKFVNQINPTLVVLVKYEFWPNLLHSLAQKKVPVISVSSIFRADQIFFRSYGAVYLNALKSIKYFFVQNQESKALLEKHGIDQVSVSGDTRFDRVKEITSNVRSLPEIENFLNDKPCWVIGSAWPEDLEALNPLFQKYKDTYKFIIAPHHVDDVSIRYFEKNISIPSVRYQNLNSAGKEHNLLIIDQIGLLSALYSYAKFAWVGGAFGKGLHNILEASAYGVPVFFGNKNYTKFQEAVDLIQLQAAFACPDFESLDAVFNRLEQDANFLYTARSTASKYVSDRTGATRIIIDFLKAELPE